jgi:hypothetical protein
MSPVEEEQCDTKVIAQSDHYDLELVMLILQIQIESQILEARTIGRAIALFASEVLKGRPLATEWFGLEHAVKSEGGSCFSLGEG